MSGFSLRARIGTIGATLILVGLAGAAFADARSFDDRVLRNVTINGTNVGGLSAVQLDAAIDRVEESFRAAPVRIATSTGGFSAPGAAFGLTIDRPRLRNSVMVAGRDAAIGSRLRRYVAAFTTPLAIPVPVLISRGSTVAVLQDGEGSRRRDPVDPKLKVRNGRFTILPGSDGEGIDAALVASTIEAEVKAGRVPVTISATSVPLPSSYTTEELQALSAQATALTASPIAIVANAVPFTISSDDLRRWVKPTIVNRQVRITLDPDKTMAGLQDLLGGKIVRPARNAQLLVGATGEVISIPSENGLRCCAASATARLEDVFRRRSTPPVSVDLEVITPTLSTETVNSYGVKEMISSFTTRHRAGEDRVKNIHRIADLLRGTIIAPGETFSVNDTIGPRTEAKGFVEAHVIEDGVFKESFGGGISQFATTLFNASFFAGLDIPAYKAHSIYISRYPYGREATLSYPRPDLKVRNSTPYGVMIWPTYTASSITVTLYSTKFATGVVSEQNKTTRGLCADVETVRTITRLDGTAKTDRFRAVYLPGEGINCDGAPTPGVTTTTIKAPPQTRPSTGSPVDTAATSDGTPGTTGSGGATTPKTSKPETTPVPAARPANSEVPVAATKAPASTPPTTAPASGTPVGVAPPVTGVSP